MPLWGPFPPRSPTVRRDVLAKIHCDWNVGITIIFSLQKRLSTHLNIVRYKYWIILHHICAQGSLDLEPGTSGCMPVHTQRTNQSFATTGGSYSVTFNLKAHFYQYNRLFCYLGCNYNCSIPCWCSVAQLAIAAHAVMRAVIHSQRTVTLTDQDCILCAIQKNVGSLDHMHVNIVPTMWRKTRVSSQRCKLDPWGRAREWSPWQHSFHGHVFHQKVSVLQFRPTLTLGIGQ